MGGLVGFWWMDGWFGLVDGVVGPQYCCVSPWHFDISASSKIDDVLTEDGGLLHFLPFAVHLKLDGKVGWTILDHSYFLNFFVGPLLHA